MPVFFPQNDTETLKEKDMGNNMLRIGQKQIAKVVNGRDLTRLTSLVLAAYLGLGLGAKQSTTVPHVNEVITEWYFSPDESRGFAPVNYPQAEFSQTTLRISLIVTGHFANNVTDFCPPLRGV